MCVLVDLRRSPSQPAGFAEAYVVIGDGTLGLPVHAPYDGVVVAAAFPDVPALLAEQLTLGGRRTADRPRGT
jgi:protein-L-isoaspartate(D-aspartate) O-methyltransferase